MKRCIVILIPAALFSCSSNPDNCNVTETVEDAALRITGNSATDEEKLERIYYFVRDEIKFNWIYPQDIEAEQVLANGRGVCMQKANLFTALARQSGFKTRFRFVYVRKQALEDFVPAWAYKRWQDPFPHTVIEVFFKGSWVSFDPTFDAELMRICSTKSLNYGRYPDMRKRFSPGFSVNGVTGAQELWAVDEPVSFYGEDLTPLIEYERKNVPFFKRMLKPYIFKQAGKIMDDLRM